MKVKLHNFIAYKWARVHALAPHSHLNWYFNVSFCSAHYSPSVSSFIYISGNDGAILIYFQYARYIKCMSNMWVSISTGHTIFANAIALVPHVYTWANMCMEARKISLSMWAVDAAAAAAVATVLPPQTVIGFIVPYHFIAPLKWHDEENNSFVSCRYTQLTHYWIEIATGNTIYTVVVDEKVECHNSKSI